MPKNWTLHAPPLPIQFGTHHSKFFILGNKDYVRIAIHTANLIQVDWENKTQGLWKQDFPRKTRARDPENNPSEKFDRCSSEFEDDLVLYLQALKWPTKEKLLPQGQRRTLNPYYLRQYDFSSASVRTRKFITEKEFFLD